MIRRWFRDQVKAYGPWDYKRRGPVYEEFGNCNFGAAGYTMVWPLTTLLQEAGRANQKADPMRKGHGLGEPPSIPGNPWGGTPPYGDFRDGADLIRRGYDFVKCYKGRACGSQLRF
jgi:hypothetical protein